MIKVTIELSLVYPYRQSLGVLLEFCGLWDSSILYGGTLRSRAIISMPSKYFKTIFGSNPVVREYPVPRGMEYFVDSVIVKKVVVKDGK